MIELQYLQGAPVKDHPYRWAAPENLFAPQDASRLASAYPRDHFKTVQGSDGEKEYAYEVRGLIPMGTHSVRHRDFLSTHWQALADDLLSTDYRTAVTACTGVDVAELLMEVNVYHYGPGAWLGPHVDLKDKVVTHVLYFNESWNKVDGGCLTILRSANEADVEHVVVPLVGQSALIVRADNSWHMVTRVRPGCQTSRRSMTVTFWRPGSASAMWTGEDAGGLHWYADNVPRDAWLKPAWQHRPAAIPHVSRP